MTKLKILVGCSPFQNCDNIAMWVVHRKRCSSKVVKYTPMKDLLSAVPPQSRAVPVQCAVPVQFWCSTRAKWSWFLWRCSISAVPVRRSGHEEKILVGNSHDPQCLQCLALLKIKARIWKMERIKGHNFDLIKLRSNGLCVWQARATNGCNDNQHVSHVWFKRCNKILIQCNTLGQNKG